MSAGGEGVEDRRGGRGEWVGPAVCSWPAMRTVTRWSGRRVGKIRCPRSRPEGQGFESPQLHHSRWTEARFLDSGEGPPGTHHHRGKSHGPGETHIESRTHSSGRCPHSVRCRAPTADVRRTSPGEGHTQRVPIAALTSRESRRRLRRRAAVIHRVARAHGVHGGDPSTPLRVQERLPRTAQQPPHKPRRRPHRTRTCPGCPLQPGRWTLRYC